MADAVMTVRPRKAIPTDHTWNSTSLFDNDAAWEGEYRRVADLIPTIEQYKGRLHEGAHVVADAFDTLESVLLTVGKIFIYAQMSYAVDTTNQAAATMNGRSYGLYGRSVAASSYIDPELLAIGKETLTAWLAVEPRLADYSQYLDNLFRMQQHVRSSEVEEVLGMTVEPFSTPDNNWSLLTNADMKFQPARDSNGNEMPLMQGNIESFLASPDRELRRTAWQNYRDGYLAFKNTLGNNLAGAVKQDVFTSRVRRYSSALEGSLFPNNIPTAVFYNLINVFKKNLPTWQRYWAARRKALGVDKLHTYDIWAPLSKNPPVVPYEQAVQWICEGMVPLGKEYVGIMRNGCLEDRWVDIYPNQGKQSGAFSTGWKGTYPFIMMSFQDSLVSMSTLAHELGHSMHSYFTWENQPFAYSNYSLFVAEVASNFNQALVRAYLFDKYTDKEFQLALIDEAMNNFHRYFFIMPTLARFELEFHERVERGDSPSADDLNKLMLDLFSEGYGEALDPEGERTGITWATFPHLYANFYVFQYATGISAAHSLANGILAGKPDSVEKYLEFLKSGSSRYPLDVLQQAGVDLTTPEPVEQTFAVLAGIVDRLEKLVE
jgi:oligoendopeptidase F